MILDLFGHAHEAVATSCSVAAGAGGVFAALNLLHWLSHLGWVVAAWTGFKAWKARRHHQTAHPVCERAPAMGAFEGELHQKLADVTRLQVQVEREIAHG